MAARQKNVIEKLVTDEDLEKTLNSAAAEGNTGALQMLLCAHTARANRDPKQAQPLRDFIAANPDLFKKASVVAYGIRQSLIRKIGGDNSEGTAISLEGEYHAIFDRLSTDGDGEMEKLLITRIAMSWLRVLSAETACIVLMGSTATFRELSVADKLLTRAHNRYVKALESLGRVRVLTEAVRMARAKANLLEAKSGEAKINKSNAAMKLLKSATG